MTDAEMQALLIEHMGTGFLENIIALFRQEPELARFLPAMISDERVAVRLGATALVEELAGELRDRLAAAVPGLIGLLESGSPTVRGDAANLLGIIGGAAAREALGRLRQDPHAAVREIVRDALRDMG
jgi:HEAT repeat protein